MLNVFDALLNAIQTGIDFLVNIVTGLASMIGMIGETTDMLGTMVAYIPAEIAVYATASVAIIIVYLIIGR